MARPQEASGHHKRGSYTSMTSVEWRLNAETFSRINQLLGPCRTDLFATRINTQLEGTLRLATWRVSEDVSEQEAYQRRLQSSLQELGVREPTPHINQLGLTRWVHWCFQRDLEPYTCDVKHFVNFLASLFNQGLQHRSVNTTHSAVSVFFIL